MALLPSVEVKYAPDDYAQLTQPGPPPPPPGQVVSLDDPVLKKAIEILQGAGTERKAA